MGLVGDVVRNLPRPPTKAERVAATGDQTMNPIKIAGSLSAKQWMYFVVGMMAWVMDAFDFFAVSLTLGRLEVAFGKTAHTMTTSITLTLLFRSFGALLFGAITDRYGRRWPLTINLLIVAALELGSGFVNTYPQFLAVRSLFGIGMGGIWGMAAATALENAPAEARGFLSGIMQQGYALGYLLAAAVNLTLVADKDNWRVIFWLGAGLSLFVAICRALTPESEIFLAARAHAKANPDPQGRSAGKIYLSAMGTALRLHWLRFIFAVLLMTGMNFYSHGSQDLYPTYARVSKGVTEHQASVLTIIGNCGAITGGCIAGYVSQYLGRRLTIICFVLWTACFIPLWIIPDSFAGLAAGAFFVQVGVQGAWGVIPIYLNELAPPAFRAIFAGLAYQLGNMVSSASAQIEATAGAQHKILVDGKEVPNYALVQGILIGVVSAYLLVLLLLGKEFRGRHFETEKLAIEAGAGDDRETEAELVEGAHIAAIHHGDVEYHGDAKQTDEKLEKAEY